MDACQYFNLTRPPFEPAPDPAFFHDIASHSEALATIQYVARYRKRCGVVIGPSGSGKTLLARIVAENINQTAPVFWVHGGAQSDNQTEVRIYPPRTFNNPTKANEVINTTLRGETHIARFMPDPPLLIVDAADVAPTQLWRDVLAWVANEVRYPKPVNVLLFGLPGLLDILNQPEMECLRQRIFRACRLDTLTADQMEEYIAARIKTAGGDLDDIFNADALARIVAAAEGIPGKINKLCDNALIEAFGEERTRVTLEDVNAVLDALYDARLEEQVTLVQPKSQLASQLRDSILDDRAQTHITQRGINAAHLPPLTVERERTEADVDFANGLLKDRIDRLRDRVNEAMDKMREVSDEKLGEGGAWRASLPDVSALTARWAEEEELETAGCTAEAGGEETRK